MHLKINIKTFNFLLTGNLIAVKGRMRPRECLQLNCVSDLWNGTKMREMFSWQAISSDLNTS